MTEENISGEVVCREVAARNTIPKSFPAGQKSLLEEILSSPQDFIPIFGAFCYYMTMHRHTDLYHKIMTGYAYATAAGIQLLPYYLQSGS